MDVPGGETIPQVYSNSLVPSSSDIKKVITFSRENVNRNIITASNEEARNFCVKFWSTEEASACYANHMVVYMSL